jgi:hypothetical protein
MIRGATRTQLVIAAVLTLLLTAAAATPVAGVQRLEGKERLAHKLINCLRTGGKVTTSGACKGMNSGRYSVKRPKLQRSQRISDRVSWPWAKRTVLPGSRICGHSLGTSTVDKRFRSVGLKHIDNGENIGCSSGWSAKRMVITMARWWYDEKKWGGPHWRQLKSPKFKSAGYGVSKRGNHTRLVVNFYGKRVP